jgi:hypothetical protein
MATTAWITTINIMIATAAAATGKFTAFNWGIICFC